MHKDNANDDNPEYLPLPEKGRLSAAFKKAVGDYMLVETSLEKADAIFVFGNRSRAPLAEKAASIYHDGLAPRIIVSGGVYGEFDKTEAIDITDRLVELGVPRDIILVENKAHNTGENVIFSKAQVEKEWGKGAVKSVIAVGHISAARRFLMTLNQQWPGLKMMSAPMNPYKTPRQKWHANKRFKKLVLKEYAKIPVYKRRGFIKELPKNFKPLP